MSSPVYELRIALEHISPAIWRDFRVSAGMSLEELHEVILAVMGWEGGHLYLFRKDNTIYANALLRDVWNPPLAEKTMLADLLEKPGDEMGYVYDLGDDWHHRITLRRILPPSEKAPVCLDGERACPPEDSGGPPGYYDILAVLAGNGPEHRQEILDWLEEDYDPEAFSVDHVNARLDQLVSGTKGSPNSIAAVVTEFLDHEEKRVSRNTHRKYEQALDMLTYAINVYGGGDAGLPSASLMRGDRDFIEVAEMDALFEYLPEFFGYFLPRKMFATEQQMIDVRATLRRLVAWMAETGRMDGDDATHWRQYIRDKVAEGMEATRLRWHDFTELPPPLPEGEVEEMIEDHFTVTHVKPGKLWVDHPEDPSRLLALEVTRELSSLCTEGMELGLALVKIRGEWYLEEVYNAYPY